eukprot:6177739-Pleurochrysis_carterae.AAC.1
MYAARWHAVARARAGGGEQGALCGLAGALRWRRRRLPTANIEGELLAQLAHALLHRLHSDEPASRFAAHRVAH